MRFLAKLDDFVPGSSMTYRERLELALGDKRGSLSLTDEIRSVEGGEKYAKARSSFWKAWNKDWMKKSGKADTQERYVEAQKASPVYASATEKAFVNLMATSLLAGGFRDEAEAASALQELLLVYMGFSLRLGASPKKAVDSVVRAVKKENFALGFLLELRFRDWDDGRALDWIRSAA